MWCVWLHLPVSLLSCSVSELFVDNPTENDRLDVKLNITLPRMKCEREYWRKCLWNHSSHYLAVALFAFVKNDPWHPFKLDLMKVEIEQLKYRSKVISEESLIEIISSSLYLWTLCWWGNLSLGSQLHVNVALKTCSGVF